jgi:uroporphyrinogen-III synthase
MERGALAGWTVGITADRRWEEQAGLLERRGARVVHGPSIDTRPVELDEGLERAIDAVIDDPPELVVLHTALGTRGWLAAADALGRGDRLLAVLQEATVYARGPKAVGAATTAGFDVEWSAPGETSAEIVAHLGDLGVVGRRIAVQRDGAPTPFLADALAAAGAEVVDIPVYRWQSPTDPTRAQRLAEAVVEHRVDAVTFTSRPALECFFDLADDVARVVDALNGAVVPVCVGIVCGAAAVDIGLLDPVIPIRGRLGAMVQPLAHEAERRRRHVQVGSVDAVLQGAMLLVGEQQVDLPIRERRLLSVLAERPGAVVGKTELLRRAWTTPPDPHAVEVAVGRLRKHLADTGLRVEVVPRRGYRLVA